MFLNAQHSLAPAPSRYAAFLVSRAAGSDPTKLAKRRHQIGSLYHYAKQVGGLAAKLGSEINAGLNVEHTQCIMGSGSCCLFIAGHPLPSLPLLCAIPCR